MANVSFKRGLQAQLPTSAVDGAFYLTTDTNRLYYGNGSTLRPINEGVITVANIDALPPASKDYIGSFYYASAENVLCVCSTPTEWTQINADTNLKEAQDAIKVATAGNNTVSATVTVQDTSGKSVTGTMKVQGKGIVNLSTGSDNTLVIDANAKADTTYTLGAKEGTASDNKAEITLTGSNGSAGAVVVEGGNNVSVKSAAADTITIEGASQQVSSISATNQAQGFKLDLAQDGNSGKTTSIDPLVKLHDGSSVHFVQGTATLDAYSTGEIDTKVSGLQKEIKDAAATMNAMKYCGTIGGEGSQYPDIATLLKSDSLHNGDTYKAGTSGIGQGAKAGDLIIVQGDENDQGIIPASTGSVSIIPSGDEIDTKYSVALSNTTNPNFTFESTQDASAGQKVSFISGSEDITVSGAVGNKTLDVTIDHKKYGAPTNSSEGSISAGSSAAVITGVTTSNGHITGLKTKTVTIPASYKTNASFAQSVASTANSATISSTLTVDGTGQTPQNIKLASSSLKFSNVDKQINVDLEWGSFK